MESLQLAQMLADISDLSAAVSFTKMAQVKCASTCLVY